MTIYSLGYDASVGEQEWALLAPFLGHRTPIVAGATDFEVVATSGHQVRVRGGYAAGWGIRDYSDADTALTVPVAPTGVRHDLVVIRRDWSGTSTSELGTNVGGKTSIAIVTGGSAAARPTITQQPGLVTQQPLALIRVTAGASTVTVVEDYRATAGEPYFVRSTAAGLDLPIGSIFYLPSGDQYVVTPGMAGEPTVQPWKTPAAPYVPPAPTIPRVRQGTATAVQFNASATAVLSHGLGYRPAVMMFSPRATQSNEIVVVQLSTQSGAITETNVTVVAKRATTTGSVPYTGALSYIDWIALG